MRMSALAAAAVAAALAVASAVPAAAAPAGRGPLGKTGFSNGSTGKCLPNTGNAQWSTGATIKDTTSAEWTGRPGGCYLQVQGLFKTSPTSGYTKDSGWVVSLSFWTGVTADSTQDTLAAARYRWQHCDGPGHANCGQASDWHGYYP